MVQYNYDQGGFKGALSQACVLSCTAGAGTVIDTFGYDPFRRVITSTQQIGAGVTYPFGYAYSLTDQLTQMRYPSGRIVQYGLDNIDRIHTVTNGGNGSPYASVNYTSAPENTISMTLGNGVTEQPGFNDRFQPTGLVATTGVGSPLLQLDLYPCANQVKTCATGNNGNVLSQKISTPSLTTVQTYSYDAMNRLTNASEGWGSTVNWSQSYSYVGNGNRWVSGNTGNPPLRLTVETPTTDSAYTSSPVANRINTWFYDNNGNIRTIPSYRSFSYDAENRTVGATMGTGGTATTAGYTFDALGQRVSKTVSGQPTSTIYVYDAFGNLAAEYGAMEASPCVTSWTCYVTVDHLGSMRMMTDTAGTVQSRYDYQPFGGELWANVYWRTTAMKYQLAEDGLNPKFTGQSRDAETGLDWFPVRHYSQAQGRFQSVDPGNAGANPGDPQTWNMYAYVGNNPMSSTDPSGMFGESILLGAAGGPVGFGIGLGVDIGIGLWGVFGGGGHTPTLQDFSFPDQVPDALNGAASFVDQNTPPVQDVGVWEGMIPIWGSGKQAYAYARRGCVQGALVNGGLAISDVFLVDAIVESVGKGAWKLGSNSWSATRKWYGATRDLAPGTPVHHWLIPQNGWGKEVPNAVKNQPWNLMPINPKGGLTSREWHQAIHGVGDYALGTAGRVWEGTPAWAKNSAINVGGRIAQVSDWVTCSK